MSRQGWRSKTVREVIVLEARASFDAILAAGFDSTDSSRSNTASRLDSAKTIVKRLAAGLLLSFESLQASRNELSAEKKSESSAREGKDAKARCERIAAELDVFHSLEEVSEFGLMTLSRLGAELCQLWGAYWDAFGGDARVQQRLKSSFRRLQLARLEESIFIVDHAQQALLDAAESTRVLSRHNQVWELMKRAPYYANLPPLSLECVECDGVPLDVPVIFADRYVAISGGPPVASPKRCPSDTEVGDVSLQLESNRSRGTIYRPEIFWA